MVASASPWNRHFPFAVFLFFAAIALFCTQIGFPSYFRCVDHFVNIKEHFLFSHQERNRSTQHIFFAASLHSQWRRPGTCLSQIYLTFQVMPARLELLPHLFRPNKKTLILCLKNVLRFFSSVKGWRIGSGTFYSSLGNWFQESNFFLEGEGWHQTYLLMPPLAATSTPSMLTPIDLFIASLVGLKMPTKVGSLPLPPPSTYTNSNWYRLQPIYFQRLLVNLHHRGGILSGIPKSGLVVVG